MRRMIKELFMIGAIVYCYTPVFASDLTEEKEEDLVDPHYQVINCAVEAVRTSFEKSQIFLRGAKNILEKKDSEESEDEEFLSLYSFEEDPELSPYETLQAAMEEVQRKRNALNAVGGEALEAAKSLLLRNDPEGKTSDDFIRALRILESKGVWLDKHEIEKILKEQQNNETLQLFLAEKYVSEDRVEEAIEIYKKYSKMDQLIECYLTLNDLEEAEKLYKYAHCSTENEDLNKLNYADFIQENRQDYSRAEQLYLDIAEKGDFLYCLDVQKRLFKMYQQQARYGEAEIAFYNILFSYEEVSWDWLRHSLQPLYWQWFKREQNQPTWRAQVYKMLRSNNPALFNTVSTFIEENLGDKPDFDEEEVINLAFLFKANSE